MACIYKGLSFNDRDSFAHKDLLISRGIQFINVLYFVPVGTLLQMDKRLIRHSLAKAKLVCQWLEGILKFADKFDGANSNKEGR